MDEHGMLEMEIMEDRMIEDTIEALVEAEQDVDDAQRERDAFLGSTPAPRRPAASIISKPYLTIIGESKPTRRQRKRGMRR